MLRNLGYRRYNDALLIRTSDVVLAVSFLASMAYTTVFTQTLHAKPQSALRRLHAWVDLLILRPTDTQQKKQNLQETKRDVKNSFNITLVLELSQRWVSFVIHEYHICLEPDPWIYHHFMTCALLAVFSCISLHRYLSYFFFLSDKL